MFYKNKKSRIVSSVFAVFLIANFFIFPLNVRAGVWVNPSDTPPLGNTYQPVHIGPSEHAMTGTLTIGATNYASNPYQHGLMVSQGNVSIGSTQPSYDFEVRQPVGGSTYFGALPSESPLTPEFGFDVRYSTASFANPVFVGTPVDGGHAVTKDYLDTELSNIGFWDENASNEIYNTNTGVNVGIGTTNPFERLDVNGIIRSGDASSVSGSLILAGQYSGSNYINTFGGHYSSGATTIGYATRPKSGSVGYVSSAGNSNFYRSTLEIERGLSFFAGAQQTVAIGGDVSMTEVFRIDNNGYVGIGTAGPVSRFHVEDDLGVASGEQTILRMRKSGTTQGFLWGYNANGSVVTSIFQRTGGSLPMILGTSATPGAVAILNNGNVGIGTTNPGATLDIVGTLNVSGDISAANMFMARGLIGGVDVSVGSTANWPNNPPAGTYNTNYVGHSGTVMMSNDVGGSAASIGLEFTYNGQMYYHSNRDSGSWESYRVITEDGAGNVGIGTTNPGSSKLRVEGSGYFTNPVTIATPTDDAHAATKKYVDDQFASGGAGESFWNGSGDEIWNSNAGNVGIGTTPSSGGSYGLQMGTNIDMNNYAINYVSQLHFNDNVRLYDDGNSSYLNFRWGNGGAGGIRFYDGGTNLQGVIYSDGDNENFGLLDSDNNWALQINRDDFIGFRVDNSEVMRILPGGLGIGTTNIGSYGLRVEGSGYFANPVTIATPIDDAHAATKKYVDDNTSSAAKSFSITVGGDADTYYPVYWWGTGASGAQNVIRTIQIYRNYNWPAPDTWNTATHRGALNWSFSTNFGNWGGTQYGIQTHRWEQTYSTMTGGIRLGANNRAVVLWLRGGGARYDMFANEYDLETPTILYACGNIESSSDNVCPLSSPDTSITPNNYRALSNYGNIRAQRLSDNYLLGDTAIGTTDPAGSKLRVDGNVYINGELTLAGADVAEEFTTDKIYDPGTVLVMDDNGWKSAKASLKANDNSVVGVVSDMASIVMGKVDSNYKATVAMVGVVKVKVNSSAGMIKKGDLLVTSKVLGEAMKSDSPKVGTVIGKALEDAQGASDEIMALVNLQ